MDSTFTYAIVDKSDKTITLKDIKAPVIALYFSAHWCPPCRAFTPKLAEFYQAINATEERLEIVFVSWDKDEASFKDYYSHMPWLTISFNEPGRKDIGKTYQVDGIPTLVLVDRNGTALDNGRFVDEDLFNSSKTEWESVFQKWASVKA